MIFRFDRKDCNTLPETNSSPLKIGRAPKGNDRIPTINFQGRFVSFRDGKPNALVLWVLTLDEAILKYDVIEECLIIRINKHIVGIQFITQYYTSFARLHHAKYFIQSLFFRIHLVVWRHLYQIPNHTRLEM